jgi:hypothetical protein
MLIGSKATVAAGIAVGRHRLTPRRYGALLAATGGLLVVLALLMAITAVRTL